MKITPGGRMFSVQSSLPHLPVPPLQQTLHKYLHSVRPLLSDEQFSKTQEIVKQFSRSPGPELQKILEERSSERTNWLSEWWKDVAYLKNRESEVVNVNPALTFPLQSYRGKEQQLRFAAKFVAGLLDCKVLIDEQTLPVETLGGKPQCMMQYLEILSACRIPGPKKDSHVFHPATHPDPPRHIVVIHNNHFFSVDVYDQKRKPLHTEELFKQLKMITELSQNVAPAVGLLTTLDRDTWADVYADLIKDRRNRTAMKEIQRSIFVLCLDKPITEGTDPPSLSAIAAEMLHGGGAQVNSGNRWFDKTIQFIIGGNGSCGLNYEHCSAEGPPVAAIMDHALDFVGKNVEDTHPPSSDLKPPRRVEFSLTAKANTAIQQAARDLGPVAQLCTVMVTKECTMRMRYLRVGPTCFILVEKVQITMFRFEDFGKDVIKSCRLSPDGFIQVALQLAYHRLYKRPCATYETASLRRFQLGRTDTIRSCSVDTLKFTEAMADSSLPNSTKVLLLREAVKSHRKYTDDAIAGKAVDRHLLGLKLAALESGCEVPQLHQDPAFTESTYFRVSTSQVGAKQNAVMLFGPVVGDGYGCCYNPQNSHINISITAYNDCPTTDSDRFANILKQSLMDMKKLLLQTSSSKL